MAPDIVDDQDGDGIDDLSCDAWWNYQGVVSVVGPTLEDCEECDTLCCVLDGVFLDCITTTVWACEAMGGINYGPGSCIGYNCIHPDWDDEFEPFEFLCPSPPVNEGACCIYQWSHSSGVWREVGCVENTCAQACSSFGTTFGYRTVFNSGGSCLTCPDRPDDTSPPNPDDDGGDDPGGPDDGTDDEGHPRDPTPPTPPSEDPEHERPDVVPPDTSELPGEDECPCAPWFQAIIDSIMAYEDVVVDIAVSNADAVFWLEELYHEQWATTEHIYRAFIEPDEGDPTPEEMDPAMVVDGAQPYLDAFEDGRQAVVGKAGFLNELQSNEEVNITIAAVDGQWTLPLRLDLTAFIPWQIALQLNLLFLGATFWKCFGDVYEELRRY